MSSVTIRPLAVDDIAALQELDQRAHGESWSRAAFVDQIDEPRHHHLVAIDVDGCPVAHAASWLDGDVLRVTNVACDPASSGQGLATRLLADLLSGRRARSSARTVSLEVRPRNRRAQRLYARFGFVPAGVARNFYQRSDDTGSRDALVMRIDDTSAPEWQRRVSSLVEPAETEGAIA